MGFPNEMPAELDSLFESLWPEVYNFIYYKVQNKEEAEELTQETFMKVYPKFEEGAVEKSKYRSYIYSAAQNMVISLWRSRRGKPQMVNLDDENSFHQLADKKSEVEEKMVVENALNSLPKEAKDVLNWRIVEGYSVKEVADKLGKTEVAVRSIQHRAVKALKEKLEKGGYFDDWK